MDKFCKKNLLPVVLTILNSPKIQNQSYYIHNYRQLMTKTAKVTWKVETNWQEEYDRNF